MSLLEKTAHVLDLLADELDRKPKTAAVAEPAAAPEPIAPRSLGSAVPNPKVASAPPVPAGMSEGEARGYDAFARIVMNRPTN